MDLDNTVFAQWLDYRLYEGFTKFIQEWRESEIIDRDTASCLRASIEDELNRRQNSYLNEMNVLIKEAFNYHPLTQADHPDRLLWGMLKGNF